MCSIGEDDYGDEGGLHAMPIDQPETNNITTTTTNECCNKCGLPGANYKLNFRAAECRECFLAYARHKFRAALGSSKVLPRNAEVLLVIDGSAESLVLLDMLHYAQTQNTFKRLHCAARVLYVDESALNENIENDLQQKLTELVERYAPFEFYVIPLTSTLEQVPDTLQKLQESTLDNRAATGEDLLHRINTLSSLTSRQDYLQQWRKRLIARVAKHLNCGYVFVPSISTALAAQLLTAVALGRGGSAALDVALLDTRLFSAENIKLVRPLKDLNEAEVELYIRAQQLTPLQHDNTMPEYGANLSSSASLQNLTRAFVTNLQQNYNSTVSTVFRTGDKIAANQQTTELLESNSGICNLCQSPLDYLNSDTLLAIEFSAVVSAAGNALDDANALEQRAREKLNATEHILRRNLCHACRNIHAELTSSNNEDEIVLC